MLEADERLAEQDVHIDLLRVRGFPFNADVEQFIAEHDQVFVVEQNRDAQLRSLLVNELEIDPKRLLKLVHFDGTPITAKFIADGMVERLQQLGLLPAAKVGGGMELRPPCHGLAWPGPPGLLRVLNSHSWMAGPSPAMTRREPPAHSIRCAA